MGFKDTIEEALRDFRPVTLRSFLLRERGEAKLHYILYEILKRYGNTELMGPVHAATRELVQNASKASLKRILFDEQGLHPRSEEDYQKGMTNFRKYLVESQLNLYRARIVDSGLFFAITFKFSERALNVMVRNLFTLFPAEEIRIRDKFVRAKTLDNLYDFYMQHGDVTEGAGMGIAMVEILLSQAGIDRHNFTIFTDHHRGQTVARIVLPFQDDFVVPRKQFENEMERSGDSAEVLREKVRRGEFKLEYL